MRWGLGTPQPVATGCNNSAPSEFNCTCRVALSVFQFFLFKRTRKRPKPTSFRDGEAVTLQADIKEQKRRYFIIENASMVFESLKLSRRFKLLLQFRHFLSVTSSTHPRGTTTLHTDKAHARICQSNQTNGKSESPNSRLSSDDVEENGEGGKKKREMKVQLSTSSFWNANHTKAENTVDTFWS